MLPAIVPSHPSLGKIHSENGREAPSTAGKGYRDLCLRLGAQEQRDTVVTQRTLGWMLCDAWSSQSRSRKKVPHKEAQGPWQGGMWAWTPGACALGSGRSQLCQVGRGLGYKSVKAKEPSLGGQ